MKSILIHSLDELGLVTKELLQKVSRYPVVCFSGEMGTGKTTLIKHFCRFLGVKDEMSSPTFSIVNEYRDSENNPVYHFDFYRLKDEQEAFDIGIEEYLDSGNICLIEWAYMFPDIIPPDHLEICINLVGETNREITLVEHGR